MPLLLALLLIPLLGFNERELDLLLKINPAKILAVVPADLEHGKAVLNLIP
jgi:hypothetical protein